METTASRTPGNHSSNLPGLLFLLLVLILAVALPVYHAGPAPSPDDHRLKMEKNSGRNGKHSSEKARQSAEKNYERVKKELNEINDRRGKAPQKSPEEKRLIDKLVRQLDHWRKKKNWSGENHSQRRKGN